MQSNVILGTAVITEGAELHCYRSDYLASSMPARIIFI